MHSSTPKHFKPSFLTLALLMSGCFICDQDDPEDKVYAQLIERYRKTLRTPINVVAQTMWTNGEYALPLPPPTLKIEEKTEPIITAFQPPSLAELLAAKGSLKKTETVVKGILENNDKNSVTPSPPPAPPAPPAPPVSKVEPKNNSIVKKSKNKNSKK